MDEMTVEDARSLLMDARVSSGAREGDTGAGERLEDAPSVQDAAQVGDAASDGAASQPEGEQGMPAEGAQPADDEQRSFVDGAVGLGVDIVEIERMEGILARRPQFAEQVFSPAEREYCESMASPATHYALRFAAKEAVVKALGTGFSEGIWVHDIEVERNKKGRPIAKLSGRALEVAKEQGVRDLALSLSYTRTDAVACALAVTESSVRASEKRKDPMEELARQFKETRKILDEL